MNCKLPNIINVRKIRLNTFLSPKLMDMLTFGHLSDKMFIYLILKFAGSITQITYANIFCDRCPKVNMSFNFGDKNVFNLIFQTFIIFGSLQFILELRDYLKKLSQLST